MKAEESTDEILMLPMEDYFMLRYIAKQEKTTPAELIKSWMFGFLDAKGRKEYES